MMEDGGSSSRKGSSSAGYRYLSSSSSRRYSTGVWTNERHLRFLNSIEASFVQAMFENINYKNGDNYSDDLRLDRHVPDSSESTKDLPNLRRRPRTFSTNSTSSDTEEKQSVRASKKYKGQLPDQVVPQVGMRRDNESDKDGKKVDVST